jgi:hypothetical protein
VGDQHLSEPGEDGPQGQAEELGGLEDEHDAGDDGQKPGGDGVRFDVQAVRTRGACRVDQLRGP